MNLREVAIKYHNLGLSVIPVGQNKIPIGRWMQSKFERQEPNGLFNNCAGIGIVCGQVSGGLFTIDFDTKNDLPTQKSWEVFKSLLSSEQKQLLKKCFIESTPTGGKHVIYRTTAPIGGSEKLAGRNLSEQEQLVNPKVKFLCLVETRGEAGYVQVAPTEGYTVLNGSFENLPVLTQEEHDGFIAVCKSMDTSGMWAEVKEEKVFAAPPKKIGLSVFDDFNMRSDVPQILEEAGWVYVETQGHNMRYRRAGNTSNRTSADWHTEKRLFYVFTSSTEFEMNRAYNAVQVYTMLKFGELSRDSYRDAAQELRKLGYGEQDVQEDEIDKQIELEKTNHYLADDEEIDKFLEDIRNDRITMGAGIGMGDLDEYWLHKPSSFNMITGMANIGKTDNILWWFVELTKKHEFNWMVCTMENETGEVLKIVMEYYTGENIKKMDSDTFAAAKAWAKEHFTIFSNKRTYTYKDVLDAAVQEMRKKPYAGLLLDPINSMELDVNELKIYGEYRYHYRSATQMRLFTKQTGCSLYLIAHPNTEANKRMKDGFIQAPYAADVEFGSMWLNRCDNFLVLHRMTNHPSEWNVTEWHVRKIKSVFTGGKITMMPVRLHRQKDPVFLTEYGQKVEDAHVKFHKKYDEEPPF